MADEFFLLPDRVFDGTSVREATAVGVIGSTISRMLPASDVPPAAVCHRLDGGTLTPGLIDAHVHMCPWMVFGLIAAGVTTVRDTGNDVDEVRRLLDRLGPDVPRPHIEWSGPLLEGTRVNWPPVAVGHRSADEIRSTVDALANTGLRNIKLYANATPDLMAAATAQAHRHDMRVLAHLGASAFGDAVAAGVDELQHLAGCLAAHLDVAGPAEALDLLSATPLDHCVTLIVWETLAQLGRPRLGRDQAMEWVPEHIAVAWAEAHHASQPTEERARRMSEVMGYQAAIRHLHEAGRTILVGSDSPFAGLIPGFALHDEAGLLVEAGLAAVDVMRSMTAGNSEALRRDDVGRLQAGARADMALFDGDPTSRIADLSRVRGVWLGGEMVRTDDLRPLRDEYFRRVDEAPIDRLAAMRYTPAPSGST